MKFSSIAVVALSAVFCRAAEGASERGLRHRLPSETAQHRKLGKKDCNDVVTGVITSCNARITEAGRYILEEDLKCGPFESGIIVDGAIDVQINCQDHYIRGDKDEPGLFGIGVGGGAFDVTVANCKVRRFENGMYGDEFTDWTALTVRESSFKKNDFGMNLFGFNNGFTPAVTVYDSKFDENNIDGIFVDDTDATYISSSANRNGRSGIIQLQFFRFPTSTLIDMTIKDNFDGGIVSDLGMDVNVMNSEACGNQGLFLADLELSSSATAQANTCDTSFPAVSFDGIPLCECSCKGGSSKSSPSLDMAAALGDARIADANSTVAVSNTTVATMTKEEYVEKLKADRHGALSGVQTTSVFGTGK